MDSIRTACLVTVFLMLSLGHSGSAAEPSRLRVVFSEKVFADVNRNDAMASTKAWIEGVGRRRGIDIQVEVASYGTVGELRNLVREHGADLFIVSSMQYLEMASEPADWDPMFMPVSGNSVREEYLLLTRQWRFRSLAELQGKPMAILRNTGAHLGRPWMEHLLQTRLPGERAVFLAGAEDVGNPSSAILPVFFGQKDACVVPRSAFEVMAELNPQVGLSLEVLATSPPYLETVICVHKHHMDNRDVLIDSMHDLHVDPAGRQLLMVFKIDSLIPFAADTLRSLHELVSPPHTPGGAVQ